MLWYSTKFNGCPVETIHKREYRNQYKNNKYVNNDQTFKNIILNRNTYKIVKKQTVMHFV